MAAGRVSVRWLANLALWSCFPLALSACAPDTASPPPPAELSAAVLRAATYTSQWVDEGEVRLENGLFEDADRRIMVFFLPEYAAGDLDGDGAPDAAVLLATTTGGSGTFHDLAAVLNRDGEPENAATFFLGDRVTVERIRIIGGEIQLDLVMHGPADPMCCPSVQATRRFRLVAGDLVESDAPAPEAESEP
ncbi:MAG: hypothetical protein KJO44_08855 [Gemmatimonadetes bacterium]|nr:hypothetical protein [Gemmatimonadota bacterium]